MSKLVREEQWVWVVVQAPGGNEQFLGHYNEEDNISFIPAFLVKQEAEEALPLLPKVTGARYEVQAIQIEDLSQRAAASGFRIYALNGKGEVLEKIDPS